MNHNKRTERLYKREGLALRTKGKKKFPITVRASLPVPTRINDQLALAFVRDRTATERTFRCLAILDIYARECPAIHVDTSIPAQAATEVLDRLIETRGKPQGLVVDNGPECTGQAFLAGAEEHQIHIIHINPGKPTENGFIESFQGKFRDEFLNLRWFTPLHHPREKIETWRQEHSTDRPHSSLSGLAPHEFPERMALTG